MRRFLQVDVFTAEPGRGNPVAVVLDAEGLSTEQMQRLANWTNLSETTFVLPADDPSADYRVRIFTPDRELRFAGHPTLGTCTALLAAGDLKPGSGWVQECAAGPVEIRRLDGGALAFAAPTALIEQPLADEGLLERALCGLRAIDPTVIEIGPRWLTARVSPAELADLRWDPAGYAALGEITSDVTLYAVDPDGALHVRSFFAVEGQLTEDPVCGSGNACVARHVQLTGPDARLVGGYRAFQGSHRGRDGRIEVRLGERNWVGGPAVPVISGTIDV